jgi:phosphoglycerate dehydrogenase-like enzyme
MEHQSMRGVIFTPVVGEKFRAVVGRHAELVVAGSRDEAVAAARTADLLVIDGTSYDAALAGALLADKGRLRWVQLVSMGYDGLTRHGVPVGVVVTNVGGLYAPAVAEHAIALLLTLTRRLIHSAANTAGRTHDGSQARHLRTLQGSTIALIGCGRIGREIAVRLKPFGARLIGLARTARTDPAIGDIRPIADLYDALGEVDGAILALPLTPDTRNLLSDAALAACKPGLWLVNVARGEVVDTVALAAALRDGRVGGAALDVTEPEPLPSDSELWSCPNLLVTPHVGGAGLARAPERVAELVVENIRRFRNGEALEHVVIP